MKSVSSLLCIKFVLISFENYKFIIVISKFYFNEIRWHLKKSDNVKTLSLMRTSNLLTLERIVLLRFYIAFIIYYCHNRA